MLDRFLDARINERLAGVTGSFGPSKDISHTIQTHGSTKHAVVRVTLAQESSGGRASQFRLQVVTPFYVSLATHKSLRALYLRLRTTLYDLKMADGELSPVFALASAAGILRRPCDCSVPFASREAASRTRLDPPYNGLITDSGSTLLPSRSLR
ncbi:uncharacterized protein SCHCODRAFT_02716655 [Schizophyllum commune H4-8]|uniref:uncharacterized protein n=1 Tax=Schizophyllum commune (strain H4-8 / FGSC 9210) TaxID=578458 RepID=UPI00215E83B2|nr:uncharacterized protein SCHCODRAFT_02716655 [Schizophyllum commune H4-8]KAI5886560.1 hypothetical protein SCHCODRAFT_02716655 [Schizophyllum commune H4-8]